MASREENQVAKEKALAECVEEHGRLLNCFKSGSWFTVCSKETEEFWTCYRKNRVCMRGARSVWCCAMCMYLSAHVS